MTTLLEARNSVYTRFKSQWGTTTPFCFENEKCAEEDKLDSKWVRVTVRGQGGGQETLGPKAGRKYRRRAAVFIQVMTPLVKGTSDASILAHAARAIFEGEPVDELDFDNGDIREVGSDGKFYQTLVEVNFAYEEVK